MLDLSGESAFLETVSDKPRPQIAYSEIEDRYAIYRNDVQSYFYSPFRKLFKDLSGTLPESEISKEHTRIGTNKIGGEMISGFGVALGVSSDGFFIGGPIPPGLTELKI